MIKTHAWEAIQKTLNYIEAQIDEEIEIEELAKIAELSPFYYQRLFTRLVKKPVREYIKLRRLARACEILRNKQNRILDIAMDYGFSSHETFTRAFKETYGMTPAQYRRQPVALDHFDKPDLRLNYVMVDEGVPLISEGLILEYHRKLLSSPITFLGVKGFYHFQRGKMLGERPGISEPDAIWKKFFEICDEIPCLPDGRLMGVSYYGGAPEGFSSYFVGAEVEPGTLGDCFVKWELPAREYIVCGFEAEDYPQLTASAFGKAMKHIRFWLREHGLRADGFFPEIYYRKQNQQRMTRFIEEKSAPFIESKAQDPNKREADQSSGTAYMEMWIPFKQRENRDKDNRSGGETNE